MREGIRATHRKRRMGFWLPEAKPKVRKGHVGSGFEPDRSVSVARSSLTAYSREEVVLYTNSMPTRPK
jgi:hypothetical protein